MFIYVSLVCSSSVYDLSLIVWHTSKLEITQETLLLCEPPINKSHSLMNLIEINTNDVNDLKHGVHCTVHMHMQNATDLMMSYV